MRKGIDELSDIIFENDIDFLNDFDGI